MSPSVWFVLVFSVFVVDQVFGRDCSNVESIMNCNECIRCGGHWCNKPKLGTARCSPEAYDSWCPTGREVIWDSGNTTIPGSNAISPTYSENTARIRVPNRIPVVYNSSVELKTDLTIVNTTQGFDVSLQSRTKCSGDVCTVTVETTPGKDFCSPVGRISESITVRMKVNSLSEEVNIKYNVPCACECSQRVERDSSICHFRGDYSCGVCACSNGWSGEFCEEKVCELNRGDIQCNNIGTNNECYGNGYCGPCDTCECYTDRPGSQYFDKDNYCMDLCTFTNECESCLREPDFGDSCNDCFTPIYFQPFNESSMTNKDEFNRSIWVKCNETLSDGCYLEYAAMKEDENVFVMMITFCDATAAPSVIGGVRITIPVILGIIGLVAALAAAGGYAAWKARSPPLPLTDPQYQNIGPDDCTGENPLYKPPTSSFKNPTYGKW